MCLLASEPKPGKMGLAEFEPNQQEIYISEKHIRTVIETFYERDPFYKNHAIVKKAPAVYFEDQPTNRQTDRPRYRSS